MSYFTTGAALTAALNELPASLTGTYKAFDAFYYADKYMGAYAGTLTPIEHFVQVGAARGYQPNADFNPAFYQSQFSDLAGFDAAELLYHYVRFGLNEGRPGNATLAANDWSAYLTAYPAVAEYVSANLADFGGSMTNGAIAHYVKFGQAQGFTLPNTVGQTFMLTAGVDNIAGTAGDDTIIGDNGIVSAADQVNGGAGTDTLKIYSAGTTILPSVTAVEKVYIKDTNGMDDLNVATVAGLTSLEFDTTATAAAADNTITLAAGQTLTLTAVTDGNATDGASGTSGSADGSLFVASAATVTETTINLNKVGSSTEAVDLLLTGAGVATLNLSSTGDKSYVNPHSTPAALKTLNVSGDKLLDFDDSAVTTLTTINAGAMTAGGVKVNVTGSTLDVTFTGGAGDDVFTVGGDLDVNDNIDGGAGTDTVVASDATLTSSTNTAVKGFNDTTGVEIAASSASSTITIDASVFTKQNSFMNSVAVTGFGGSGSATAAQDAVNFTFESGDTFIVGANLTGGGASAAGDAAASNGADALEVAAKVNSGTDTVTILFAAGAATTLAGGDGSAMSGAGGEAGGDAINASSVEVINIVTASALDDVTLTKGASGSANNTDDSAASISVGANATINLSGAGDVNLGTIVTQGTEVDDLTVNGTSMTGVLTVVTGAGNDIIKGGSKADVITAGAGINTVTGNGGADQFLFADDVSDATTITTITDFEMGAGKDIIKFTATAGVFEKLLSTAQDAINQDTTLADAVAEAGAQLADHETTVFVWEGNAYVVYDEASGDFSVVKLAGITDVSAFDATNIG